MKVGDVDFDHGLGGFPAANGGERHRYGLTDSGYGKLFQICIEARWREIVRTSSQDKIVKDLLARVPQSDETT